MTSRGTQGRLRTLAHPDPAGPTDLTPIEIGEIWENPVLGESATILERPWDNADGRARAELTAHVGARVAGEHRHAAQLERFTVLEGELTLKRAGVTSVLREGESGEVPPGVWHDRWNASERDARALVEVVPAERFVLMIETLFGLGRLGCFTSRKEPHPLQLALFAGEFSDVIELRSPPPAVQRAMFRALGPIARRRGYRPSYPQLSRTTLAPRP